MIYIKSILVFFAIVLQVWNTRGLIEKRSPKASKYYKCLNLQGEPLKREQICDGKFDCRDLTDEFLCPDKRLKYDSRLQYALASLQTGADLLNQDSAVELAQRMCIPHCYKPSHVKACGYCKPGEFQCPPLVEEGETCTCVKRSEICDEVMHCVNGEDENFCGEGMKPTQTPHLLNYTEVMDGSNTMKYKTEANKTFSEQSRYNETIENKRVEEMHETLAKSRIRCSLIDKMSRFDEDDLSQKPSQAWIAPRPRSIYESSDKTLQSDKSSPPYLSRQLRSLHPIHLGSLPENRMLTNSENRSVLLNWVSHSTYGEPPPIQKYITRLISGDINFTDDVIFTPSETLPNEETVGINELCDGIIHCSCFSDELLCPGKFYCQNRKPIYIDKMKIMDGVADCSDSSDEWPITRGHHTLASRYKLIGNWALQVLVWIMAITALLGNTVVICRTLLELVKLNSVATASVILQKNNHSMNALGGKVAISKAIAGILPKFISGSGRLRESGGIGVHRRLVKIWNSILVLNLASADLLMGIYLMWLAIMSSVYHGQNNTDQQYWTFDREWRTSNTCNILGAILSTSLHTSVYTLVALTSLRLYTVFKPFTVYHLKFRYLFLVCLFTWAVSICFAVIPILPITRDRFISAAWVPFAQFHPPNINQTVANNLVRGIAYITNRTLAEDTSKASNLLSWNKMVEFLKEAAPDHSDWKFYGYYSEDSVCMPKIFVSPAKDRFWRHTISIIAINFLSVIYISVAYAIIYYKTTTCQRASSGCTSTTRRNSTHRRKECIKVPQQAATAAAMQCKYGYTCNEQEEKSSKGCQDQTWEALKQRCSKMRQRQTVQNIKHTKSSTNEMQKRIALLVATDCVCWIPICIMSFLSVFGYTIPDTAYAITAIGLLPINSALNPLLYSRFMRTLWSRGWSSIRLKANNSLQKTSDASASTNIDAATTHHSAVFAIATEASNDDRIPEKSGEKCNSEFILG